MMHTLHVDQQKAAEAVWPAEQSPLAGRQAVPLSPGTRLYWAADTQTRWLSAGLARDYRESCTAHLHRSDGQTFVWDADFGSHAQRLHLAVPPGVTHVEVSAVEGAAALWVLHDPAADSGASLNLQPVPAEGDGAVAFKQRLAESGIAQFGWMLGCVLEACEALAAVDNDYDWAAARTRYLAPYLTDDGFRYQDPRGRLRHNVFASIETSLPMATIARRYPDHPALDAAQSFWLAHQQTDGLIIDGQTISTEGCYTVAYPMLQLALLRGDAALRETALAQLTLRRQALRTRDAVYLRSGPQGRTYRNWTRGIAWFLLGYANVLRLAPDVTAIATDFAADCAWILAHQRADGLWSNFLDEPELPPDTSGSAGIAVALLRAARLGLMDAARADAAAEACWSGLLAALHPDGWLGGVAPNNKRGEAAQHGRRRTSEAFALGLMGQLLAERVQR